MLYKYVNENYIQEAKKTIKTNNGYIANPTEKQLKELDYKELIKTEQPSEYYHLKYVDGEVITELWEKWSLEERQDFYPVLVGNKIRKEYSVNDELALLRQKDTKVEEYEKYNNFVEQCKIESKEELDLE